MADIGPKWVFENIEINNSLSLKCNKNKVFVVKINEKEIYCPICSLACSNFKNLTSKMPNIFD